MKRKKLLAGLTAAVMLCGAVMSVGVSAAVYDCDVNNDGAVNMLDTITLNQYLLGGFYVNDPSIFDVNGNYIIDTADSNCIMATITGNTYEITFN